MKVEFLKSVILRPFPSQSERLNAKIGSVHEVDDDVAERLFARGLAVPARRDVALSEPDAPPIPVGKGGGEQVSQSTPAASEPAPPAPPPAPKVRSAKVASSRARQAGPMAVRPVEAPVGEGGGLAEKLSD